eukprot:EG_transcript_25160
MQSTSPNPKFDYDLLMSSLSNFDEDCGDWNGLNETSSNSRPPKQEEGNLTHLSLSKGETPLLLHGGNEPSSSSLSLIVRDVGGKMPSSIPVHPSLMRRGDEPLAPSHLVTHVTHEQSEGYLPFALFTPKRSPVEAPVGLLECNSVETPCFFQPP